VRYQSDGSFELQAGNLGSSSSTLAPLIYTSATPPVSVGEEYPGHFVREPRIEADFRNTLMEMRDTVFTIQNHCHYGFGTLKTLYTILTGLESYGVAFTSGCFGSTVVTFKLPEGKQTVRWENVLNWFDLNKSTVSNWTGSASRVSTRLMTLEYATEPLTYDDKMQIWLLKEIISDTIPPPAAHFKGGTYPGPAGDVHPFLYKHGICNIVDYLGLRSSEKAQYVSSLYASWVMLTVETENLLPLPLDTAYLK
jgi:hypothetical protein